MLLSVLSCWNHFLICYTVIRKGIMAFAPFTFETCFSPMPSVTATFGQISIVLVFTSKNILGYQQKNSTGNEDAHCWLLFFVAYFLLMQRVNIFNAFISIILLSFSLFIVNYNLWSTSTLNYVYIARAAMPNFPPIETPPQVERWCFYLYSFYLISQNFTKGLAGTGWSPSIFSIQITSYQVSNLYPQSVRFATFL